MDDIYRKQKEDVLDIFRLAMDKMHPYSMIIDQVNRENHDVIIAGKTYSLSPEQKIWVIGSGKASSSMAEGLEDALGDLIADGMVICPYGTKKRTPHIQQFEAAHPIPDENSIAAGYEIVDFIRQVPAGDILIYCLSGGTSSLLCLPYPELDIEDIQQTYQLLLSSGANIHEMNIVRKHLSVVKGGGLLGYMNPNVQLIDLIISDVPGDKLEDIGSGPTTPSQSTSNDVVNILHKFNIYDKIPINVRSFLNKRVQEESNEEKAAKQNDLVHHQIVMLGTANKLAQRAGEMAEKKGYHILVSSDSYNGDVKKISKKISSDAISVLSRDEPVEKPAALIFFGESSVEVKGNGKGGRNQEMALASAISVEGQHHITMLSVGTDGRDGPTDAAGAIINSNTALVARKKGLEPENYLQNNDSYTFFSEMDSLIKTGPTGNNLMDLQIVLVNK